MSGTYSFIDTQASFVSAEGNFNIGYGAGIAEEGITVAMAGNKNSMTIGADGEGMHSLHADNSGTVTIRLLKNSPVNAKLMNVYNAQKSSSKKWGKATITINHTGSGDNYTATKCAFQKAPDYTNPKTAPIVEWVFDAIKINAKLGTYE